MNFDKIEPKFYISENNKKDIKKIEKELSLINLNNKIEIKSRVRSIYSSLAIEDNSLPLESVERIIENKLVLGDRKDIQEVKNANELYEHMNEYNWKDEKDFLTEDFCKNLFLFSRKYNCYISFSIIKNTLYIALNSFENEKNYTQNGWFNFSGKFDNTEYMKDIFQQFETTVMIIKFLNSK